MSYQIIKITLTDGTTLERRGFDSVRDGVLRIEPPNSRDGAVEKYPLTSVRYWTSEEA